MSMLPFDPQSIPVSSVDGHLPAIEAQQLQTAALRRQFHLSRLKKWKEHNAQTWITQLGERRYSTYTQLKPAAVLVGIVQRPVPTLLLTQRTSHLKAHSGQIALPGGKVDANDPSIESAALREAWEEIGIAAHTIEILGTLVPYATGSGFLVYPVVGLVDETLSPQRNPSEVEEVFEVQLAHMLNPANHQHHNATLQYADEPQQTWHWLSIPSVDTQSRHRYVWGATAGIVRMLYQYLAS